MSPHSAVILDLARVLEQPICVGSSELTGVHLPNVHMKALESLLEALYLGLTCLNNSTQAGGRGELGSGQTFAEGKCNLGDGPGNLRHRWHTTR